MMFRYLHLAFIPPRWDGDMTHLPTIHFIRYDNPDRPGEARPAWLDEPRDRPLVLAALGTVMNTLPGLFEAIIAAVDDEPIEVVAAIGRDQDPARFGTPPPNVRTEAYVPQIQVLAECAAFVTHGGFNSTKEALRLGIPLVVIPIGGDQPYTAERVEALALGRAVSPEERDPAFIRGRIREVLAEPRYRANAQRFSEEMQALRRSAMRWRCSSSWRRKSGPSRVPERGVEGSRADVQSCSHAGRTTLTAGGRSHLDSTTTSKPRTCCSRS